MCFLDINYEYESNKIVGYNWDKEKELLQFDSKEISDDLNFDDFDDL